MIKMTCGALRRFKSQVSNFSEIAATDALAASAKPGGPTMNDATALGEATITPEYRATVVRIISIRG